MKHFRDVQYNLGINHHCINCVRVYMSLPHRFSLYSKVDDIALCTKGWVNIWGVKKNKMIMSCYESIIMYTHIFGHSTVQMIAVKANSGKEEVAHICVIFRGSHWTMLHPVQHPGPKRVQSVVPKPCTPNTQEEKGEGSNHRDSHHHVMRNCYQWLS